jgi:hypothetical protein
MDMEEAASKQSAKDRLTLRIGAEKSKEMKRVVTNKSTAGAGGIILKVISPHLTQLNHGNKSISHQINHSIKYELSRYPNWKAYRVLDW